VVVSKIIYFHHYLGEDFQFDSHFSKGLVQPPTRIVDEISCDFHTMGLEFLTQPGRGEGGEAVE